MFILITVPRPIECHTVACSLAATITESKVETVCSSDRGPVILSLMHLTQPVQTTGKSSHPSRTSGCHTRTFNETSWIPTV